eukprot:4368582-Amphidinium_carterae.1
MTSCPAATTVVRAQLHGKHLYIAISSSPNCSRTHLAAQILHDWSRSRSRETHYILTLSTSLTEKLSERSSKECRWRGLWLYASVNRNMFLQIYFLQV